MTITKNSALRLKGSDFSPERPAPFQIRDLKYFIVLLYRNLENNACNLAGKSLTFPPHGV